MPNQRGYGRTYSYPIPLGGGESTSENIFQALLEEYSAGFSVEAYTEMWCEAYGEAVALAMIYGANGRVSNQMIPARMQENLPVWEKVLSIHVSEGTPLVRRRAAVESKLRTMAKNALIDIEDACRKALGANFVELRRAPDAMVYGYSPGVNPGPEGFPFTSNRAVLGIVVNKLGINEAVYLSKTTTLAAALSGMVPGWQWFFMGVDSTGFVANVGTVDQTIL